MRWFKHLTSARDDENIERLITEWGFEGYGRYFAMLEIIAGTMGTGNNSEATFSWAYWQAELRCKRFKLLKFFAFCRCLNVTFEDHGTGVTVRAPNLLKYRDEYSRKKNQQTDTETPPPENTDPHQKPLIDPELSLPCKGGPWSPTADQMQRWSKRHPRLNLEREFKKMRGWLEDNPSRLKTRPGMTRFIGSIRRRNAYHLRKTSPFCAPLTCSRHHPRTTTHDTQR